MVWGMRLTPSIHCWTLEFTSHSLSSLSLMHLLIPTLYHMKYPADTSKNASPFNLTERPKTVQLLQEFMLDVLLMPYGWGPAVCWGYCVASLQWNEFISCSCKSILAFKLDFFFFGSPRFVLNESPTRPAPSSSQGGSADGTVAAGGQGLPQPPPGMSVYAAKRVIGEAQWSAEQLEQVR